MSKKICFDTNYLLMFISFIIIILLIIYLYKSNKENYQNDYPNNKELIYRNINEEEIKPKIEEKEKVVNIINYPSSSINRDPKSLNALDRIYNPIRYPYKSDYFYDQQWYPNLEIPFQVIGGGYRNTPTLGGTEVPIYNPPVKIDISNENIAPINIQTRGPLGQPQQIGVMYKVNGNDNDILPLFGRRKYPNDNKYEYYTMIGQFGVKVPIITKNRNDELGSNDVVFIKGKNTPYRVTIYETDFPQYIPYL